MPIEVSIKDQRLRFPTPMAAITRMMPALNDPEGGIDPLALAHATCVATAQATASNTGAGRRAMQSLAKMVEAFDSGDINKGIRYAVALGMDSVLLNSRRVGVNHPRTAAAFQAAYDERAGLEPQPQPEQEPEPAPELSDDDDDENDWSDDPVETKEE